MFWLTDITVTTCLLFNSFCNFGFCVCACSHKLYSLIQAFYKEGKQMLMCGLNYEALIPPVSCLWDLTCRLVADDPAKEECDWWNVCLMLTGSIHRALISLRVVSTLLYRQRLFHTRHSLYMKPCTLVCWKFMQISTDFIIFLFKDLLTDLLLSF